MEDGKERIGRPTEVAGRRPATRWPWFVLLAVIGLGLFYVTKGIVGSSELKAYDDVRVLANIPPWESALYISRGSPGKVLLSR